MTPAETDALVQAFYRLDAAFKPAGWELRREDGEDVVSLASVHGDLDRLIACFESSIDAHLQPEPLLLFGFRVLVLVDGAYRPLDPQDGKGPWNQWQSADGLMQLCGLDLFSERQPRLPDGPRSLVRYDFEWRVEGEDLRIVWRSLGDATPEQRELYQALTVPGKTLDLVPRSLREQAKRALDGCIQERSARLPLLALAEDARRCLERLCVANHVLYGALASKLEADPFYELHHPHELLTFHLAPLPLLRMSRLDLAAAIQSAYPDFRLHPSLASVPVTAEECPKTYPDEQPVEAPAFTLEQADGEALRFVPRPLDPRLGEILDYIWCELRFDAYAIEGGRISEPEPAVRFLATHAAGLAGSWTGEPRVEEADGEHFWLADARGSLRDGLYGAPYQNVSRTARRVLHEQIVDLVFGPAARERWRVFACSTAESRAFLHELFDCLWVALDARGGEALVIHGTAVD